MESGEHQAKKVVTDGVDKPSIEVRHGRLFSLEVPADLLVCALEPLASAEVINRAMFGDTHQPSARVVPDGRRRPLLKSGDCSVLRQVFGDTYVPNYPCRTGKQARRLDPPDRVTRTICNRT